MTIAAGNQALASDVLKSLSADGYLEFAAATELTIATGAITITQNYHRVDTEGDAASDDLDTISGGAEGFVLVLRAENAARTVVVKDGTGNILISGGDFSLDDGEKMIVLIYDGTNWRTVGFPVDQDYMALSSAADAAGEGVRYDEFVRSHKTTGELEFAAATELTISTGAITVTQNYHRIDTEGDTASDDLDTISGGTEGFVLVIRAENAARTVVVKDGTGNILIPGGDYSLDDGEKTLSLIYDGANWRPTSSYAGVGGQAARIATGSYTGDGTTSQAITGIGFQPKYVRIWVRVTAGASNVCVTETSDTIVDDHASGMAIQFDIGDANFIGRTDAIISLDADGFTVDDAGADAHPNKNTVVYNYLAMG